MPFSAQGSLSDARVTLEKSATDAFGTVVEDFTKGALGAFLPSTDPNSTKPVNRNDGSWYSTSYAAALAGPTSYRPKLKFLFKVEFIFTNEAMNQFPEVFRDNRRNDFTFMIKQVDRPKVDFEYEEDVNMYNFRTKVLKKIRHRDLTIVFMDDVGNRVFDFFRTLMMIHQPITQRQLLRDNTTRPPDVSSKTLAIGNGMVFSNHDARSLVDTAHRGVVNPINGVGYGNSIECIRVKQIFVDPQSGIETASKMVAFDFINPRVMSFDLDELSHEMNDVNLLTMVFDYDWMEMVKVGSLGANGNQYNTDYNIVPAGVHGAPSDITPNHVGSSTAAGSAAGGGNALVNALTGILGRGAAQLSSDAIGKLVKTVGGNGRFATALGGAASSAISGPITGIVSGGARDLFNGGVSSAPNSTNARASSPTIVDSNVFGRNPPLSNVASSNAYKPGDPADPNGYGEG